MKLIEIMKRKNCPKYRNGELNEAHKEVFKNIRRQYPFTEIRMFECFDLCIISGFEEMCDNCGKCEGLYDKEY